MGLFDNFDPTNDYAGAHPHQDDNNLNYGNGPNGLANRDYGLDQLGQSAQQRTGIDVNYSGMRGEDEQYDRDRRQQGANTEYLRQVMMGEAGPSLAEVQMGRGVDQSLAAQMAAAHSTVGGGAAMAAAQRNAAIQGAQQQTQAVANTSALRAQEQQQARQQYTAALNLAAQQTMARRQQAIQMAQYGAGLQQQQRGLNDAMQMQAEQLRNQAALGQLGARTQGEGYRYQAAAQNAATRGNMLGGLLTMAGTVGGAMMGGPGGAMAGGALGSAAGNAMESSGGGGADASGGGSYYDPTSWSDRRLKTEARSLYDEGSFLVTSDARAKKEAEAIGIRKGMQMVMRDRLNPQPTPVFENGQPRPTMVENRGYDPNEQYHPEPPESIPDSVEHRGYDPNEVYAARAPSPTPQMMQAARAGMAAVNPYAGLVLSDENEKASKKPSHIDLFLDNVEPYSYEYKDPARHGEGRRYGVMAQDLERSPMGASTVIDTPEGKKVDTRLLTMANTGALAAVHKRLRAVERGK